MRLITSAIFGCFTLIATSVYADTLPSPRQIASHSYAWIGPYGPPTKENRGFRMNLGFVIGDDAVAVIDGGYGDTTPSTIVDLSAGEVEIIREGDAELL